MATCILLRHGRSSANTAGVLAGWTPGIALDDHGRDQVAEVAARLAGVPISLIAASPLQRCQETAAVVADTLRVSIESFDGLGECHYGAWTGRPLKDLATEELWRTVQDNPHDAVFPSSAEHRGESLREMYDRVTTTVRDLDARVEAEFGEHAVWIAVSHGDPIKSVVADVVGTGLDGFQRIHVDPASATVVRWAGDRSMLLRCNDTGRSLDSVVPRRPTEPAEASPSVARPGDAVVGGGAG